MLYFDVAVFATGFSCDDGRRPNTCRYRGSTVRIAYNQIRSPKIDPRMMDRKNLRELLDRSDSVDWDERSDTSEWSGVSLDTEERILGLNVASRNLSGELPAALGEISKLEYLHATSNLFSGEPVEIASLFNSSECRAL